jgi:hypothetical protein
LQVSVVSAAVQVGTGIVEVVMPTWVIWVSGEAAGEGVVVSMDRVTDTCGRLLPADPGGVDTRQ